MARLEWNGPEARRRGRDAVVEFLTAACILITNEAKGLLSVPGTGRVKGRRVGAGGHSPPGEPPYKQTGRLRASVTYEVDKGSLQARAGTNVDYGLYLELGTKRGIAPRPWLRPAMNNVRGKIEALAARMGVFFS